MIGRWSEQVEPGRPLFVVGPTGVGKTEFAHELAERCGARLLSMDSMQVYRGLDRGTAKPSPEERARFGYGGIDLVDWRASFSAAQYRDHAQAFLEACERRGHPVVVVGGTGLYYRSLVRGLCAAPPGDPALRRELERLSVSELAERLAAVDPEAFADVDRRNPRRLIRAIEVKEASGISIREWQARTTRPVLRRFRTLWLERPAGALRKRIAARVGSMLASGWIEEVADRLREAGPDVLFRCPAIGYARIARFLVHGGSRERLAEEIAADTYRYAKKQLTWFRKESSVRYWLMLEEHAPLPWCSRSAE
ncbi:tRNA (adenosine(37)-N6)-dimethylallyltransferase MiaA [Methylacidimicrobium sp. AP8]|uniref:tRNA (adenosine(37)-N6)-dimethylallyltransferase MiaA n=1 Tax=Methylacidimicrobium sp. AP8 TaxID=2730359 RepID=UPI001F0298AE|nr:tRNA (adenosine(37)-N6)-dimethylallyltransferase MiaA [Methylacidimicrobium sp. AP8]